MYKGCGIELQPLLMSTLANHLVVPLPTLYQWQPFHSHDPQLTAQQRRISIISKHFVCFNALYVFCLRSKVFLLQPLIRQGGVSWSLFLWPGISRSRKTMDMELVCRTVCLFTPQLTPQQRQRVRTTCPRTHYTALFIIIQILLGHYKKSLFNSKILCNCRPQIEMTIRSKVFSAFNHIVYSRWVLLKSTVYFYCILSVLSIYCLWLINFIIIT